MNELTDIATRLRAANPIPVDAFDSTRVGSIVDRVVRVEQPPHGLDPTADGEASKPMPGGRHRRPRVRSRVPVALATSMAVVVVLVVAVTVVTLGHRDGKPYSRWTTQVFTTPMQTSSATWNLTGLVAASGWHPQSVGATSPVQLICPTERTCIAS